MYVPIICYSRWFVVYSHILGISTLNCMTSIICSLLFCLVKILNMESRDFVCKIQTSGIKTLVCQTIISEFGSFKFICVL